MWKELIYTMKILHSADWHLDSPFTGYTPEQRNTLRRALRKIPGKVAEVCRREGCDLMLLSGDIFDGPYTPESLDAVRDALGACGVPVFIAPGNHDFCAPGSPWLEERWPENVHIFTGDMESVVLPELNCRVYGAAFRSMDCDSLLEGFHADGDERFCVAVLHGDATNPASPYNPTTMAQIRDSRLDYLALGHIHKAGMFHGGGTICAWPGCPMGRGFDETGERGVYVTRLGDGYDVRFVPLNTLRFHELEVDTGEDAIAALEGVLPGFGSTDFYRITLTGSGAGEIAALKEHFQHIPNLELRDQRREKPDLWATAGEDTLQGTFFQQLKNAMEDADPDSRRQIELAAEISQKLLEGREVSLP